MKVHGGRMESPASEEDGTPSEEDGIPHHQRHGCTTSEEDGIPCCSGGEKFYVVLLVDPYFVERRALSWSCSPAEECILIFQY